MQVKIEKNFPLEASAEAAWAVLQDIPTVAGCMPGAEITEQVDDSHYKGQVKVKIGPATAAFKGDIEVKGLDAAQHELKLFGKGADTKGTSSASMDLVARIRDSGDGKSELVGAADVTVTGKMASLGGRMMNQVSEQILKQFGNNFTSKVQSADTGQASAAASGGETSSAQPSGELNGLAFAWSVFVGFIKSLFGGGSKSTGKG